MPHEFVLRDVFSVFYFIVFTEIDHAFKQFVMECMDLTTVDEKGNVVPSQGSKLIPWDDPYHYFKGLPVTEEQEQDENQTIVIENAKDGEYFLFKIA